MLHIGILSCSVGARGAKRRMCIVPVRQCTGRHRVHLHFAAFQFIPGVGRFSRRPTAASSHVDPLEIDSPRTLVALQPKARHSFRRPLTPTDVLSQRTASSSCRSFIPSEPQGPFKAQIVITRKQPSFRCNADHFMRKRNGHTPLRQRRLS